MNKDLVQPAATIAGALLAASPNALRDPDAIAKVFIATYRQIEKATRELQKSLPQPRPRGRLRRAKAADRCGGRAVRPAG